MSGLNIAALLAPVGAGAGTGAAGPAGPASAGDFAGLLPEGALFGAGLMSSSDGADLLGANLDLPEAAVLLPQPVDPASVLADLDLAQATLARPLPADAAAPVVEDPLTTLLDAESPVPAIAVAADAPALPEDAEPAAGDDEAVALLIAAAMAGTPDSTRPPATPHAAAAGEASADKAVPANIAALHAAASGPIALPTEAGGRDAAYDAVDAALAGLARDGNEAAAPAPANAPALAFAAPAFAVASGKFAAFADAAPHKPVRVDAADFADGVGARLSWMAEQRVGRAEIRVSPPELGTIDVDLQIDGKQVRAEFSSAHADVRQALEAGLPRLRDMLASQGLTLSHAEVGGQGTSGQSGRGETAAPGLRDGEAQADDAAATAATPTRVLRADGLLDEYA